MSLTVKALNSDASFLLTFRPILDISPSPEEPSNAFTILLDPWIGGTSKIWHPKFSISRQKSPPCVNSLRELPEPDLAVISQEKSDHCHQQTLTQLPRRGGKTIILAVPAAAKLIRGWKHFDPNKVVTLPKWEDPRLRKSSNIYRISIAPLFPNGTPGEVTIAYVPQKKDLTGLHSAIGITYRPPSVINPFQAVPLTPPDSPRSFQSTFSQSSKDRTLSVIFSPHGVNYKTLEPYITSHLVSEAALPLTALLHCFDRVENPWYMGGNVCAGLPGGQEIAQNLCAKAWISTHDAVKETTGVATIKTVIQQYPKEEVESVVSPRSAKFPDRKLGTEAVVLQSGEEITLNRLMDFGPEESDDGHSFTNLGAVC